jgi:hypothetical protein
VSNNLKDSASKFGSRSTQDHIEPKVLQKKKKTTTLFLLQKKAIRETPFNRKRR